MSIFHKSKLTDGNQVQTATSDVQSTLEIDEHEEKKLLKKVDARLIPTVFFMYLVSYLDRSNIGNAYTGGMGKEFNMTSQDYSIVLLVFFISYVLFEPISNAILTRVRPSIYLPSLMILWGILTMCFAAAQSWQAIAGLRFILGILESSFAPGVLFLLSAWYKRGEMGRRYSLYYTAVALSGIFGGLIAGGLIKELDGARGIPGWKWLFIVEGAITCFVSIISIFTLPDFPSTTRWLTTAERALASNRLIKDSVGDTQGGDKISHKEAAKMTFTDWRVWSFVLTYMCTTGAQTIQYFIPELVKSMGYTGYDIQYFTAPIYTVAFVSILAFCFSSDYFKERALHLAAASALSVVCFAILIGVLNNTARYVLLCFGVAGVYAACPLVSIYAANAIPWPSEKRAISLAVINALGNSASIYGSFLFPAGAKDHNRTGFAVTMAFMVLAFVMAFFLRFFLAKYPYPESQQTPVAQVYPDDEANADGTVPVMNRSEK
ncbi:MFS general substrate transporter [Meira miltonrushii]|uniref:MFS general substrate transporter n=1 Tax=Meira miltonrushii TaxID=1280837 RepID=A0A316VB29_9BASI|nr:MFS general substrate transporter [Meira miltonrushii]PWN32755.1 MFS general substrate transporter [Meira miltonrushii]